MRLIHRPGARDLTPAICLVDLGQMTTVCGPVAALDLLAVYFHGAFIPLELSTIDTTERIDGASVGLKLRGVQTGAFFGIPATGRSIAFTLTLTCRLTEGRIHRLCLDYDAADLLRQLGMA